MSVLIVIVTLVTSTTLAAGMRTVADAAVDRARAQAAADAAALAAVAEWAPFGASLPDAAAGEYARRNGGEVIDVVSEAGSVTVVAAVGGAEARARAVLDPTRLAPAFLGSDVGGLDPDLEAAVSRLIAASGGRVWLVSGYRSPERQSQLWAEALARYGDPEAADDWVARPGYSMHQRGLAVDLGGDLDLAADLIERLGLPMWRPLAREAWHFELVGSRG